MQDTKDNPRPEPGAAPTQFRSAIILPDGRKPIPLGSGVVTALLGEGGMANVYEIWNSQLEVHRAVKLLHPNCSDESKQRFQTEIKITAKLHHPNIIEIHGVGQWNGLPLIEMEKIDGYTLENLVYDRGALPITACTAIGIMISRALKYAHNQVYVIYGKQYHGIIHRDLKPSNIMVCKDGAVKLMDFGIARPTDASIHTTDGSILGTMQYLSPEQLDGKEPDIRTDIYSLGTTLYEALTGVQAFPERNVSKLMMNKIRNEYKPLDEFAIKIPLRLKRLIHRCMVHDRDKRIASAALLLNELEKLHKSLTLDTPDQVIKQLVTTSPAEKIVVATRRRLPLRAIAAVLVVAFGLLGAGLITRTIQAARQEKEAKIAAQKAREEARAALREKEPEPPPAPRPAAAAPQQVSVRKARPAPAPARKPKTFTEKMTERHGTDDLLEIMVAEAGRGNHLNASMVYKQMPAGLARSTKAVIYNMRALAALGNTAELERFLASHAVDDAEVHLQEAKVAFRKSRYAEAEQLLDRALRSPRQFIDSDKLRRDVYYYKALCATAAFDRQPSEHNYKSALDAWFQVRTELRSSPEHAYNKKAVSETQRIGELYRKNKG
ncbi:MAG: protein kinase [Chitinivibrionales bacterium]|nr:protein kinase [Chitinivibrionales bacterium]MBD3394682.1 protein kinase [Chitinivibrionales bacterium]